SGKLKYPLARPSIPSITAIPPLAPTTPSAADLNRGDGSGLVAGVVRPCVEDIEATLARSVVALAGVERAAVEELRQFSEGGVIVEGVMGEGLAEDLGEGVRRAGELVAMERDVSGAPGRVGEDDWEGVVGEGYLEGSDGDGQVEVMMAAREFQRKEKKKKKKQKQKK
ncbi:hypothetical protein LTR39_005394, partial [Cryomyces antarcticus]